MRSSTTLLITLSAIPIRILPLSSVHGPMAISHGFPYRIMAAEFQRKRRPESSKDSTVSINLIPELPAVPDSVFPSSSTPLQDVMERSHYRAESMKAVHSLLHSLLSRNKHGKESACKHMLIIQPLRTGTFLQHLISSLIIIDIFKDVSRLTMQSAADRFECRKTDC